MEILVRVIDKDQPDPEAAIRLLRKGDVVAICPDGWPWSPRERTWDEWRIIRANILATTSEALLSRSLIESQVRRREYMIDINLLPDPSLFTGPRTQEIITLTKSQVQNAIVKKP